jgi:hypothetical protein
VDKRVVVVKREGNLGITITKERKGSGDGSEEEGGMFW